MTKTIILYTKQEVSTFTNQQLVSIIKEYHLYPSQMTRFLMKHNPNLLDEVLHRTRFLNKVVNNISLTVPFTARIYCLEHNLKEQPKCQNPKCNNPVEWRNGIHQFAPHCCRQCYIDDPKAHLKEEMTKEHRYGNAHYTNPEKRVRTSNLKYGKGNYNNRKKFRQTCEQRYQGIGWASPLYRKQFEQYMIDTYGVKHALQSPAILKRFHYKFKSPKYPDMSFDSSWEFKVYDFLTEHNIPFEYQIEPIPYEYDGGIYYYHPDFLVNGRIYEVKGDQYFRINEETGQEEMFQPRRNKHWSDEEYEWRCGKEEAKHQCMLAQKVVILRHKEINHLTIDLFD